MINVDITEMMDAGAHFGHQTQRWNPKMRPYIFGVSSGVHILDLQKTKDLANEAFNFMRDVVGQGKQVLFVGTKPQAREIIIEKISSTQMFYVVDRWMGGTLTNYKTIRKSIDKLIDFETRRANNDFAGYKKRELLDIDRTIQKLQASLGGIKLMRNLPGVVFIVDPKLEHIAVKECRCLGIPVIALTDSNCDPDEIDFPIPANDDAISSVQYFIDKAVEACLSGLELREQNARDVSRDDSRGDQRGGRRRRVSDAGKSDRGYQGKKQPDTYEGQADSYSVKVEPEASATLQVAANHE